MFSCEFCEIPKNTFFTEHLWATASGYSMTTLSCQMAQEKYQYCQ